jgi:hypothetical protein
VKLEATLAVVNQYLPQNRLILKNLIQKPAVFSRRPRWGRQLPPTRGEKLAERSLFY